MIHEHDLIGNLTTNEVRNYMYKLL
jgi:casein kinase II subunit alpha